MGLDFYAHLKSEQNTRLWNRRRVLAQQHAVGKTMGKKMTEVPESPFGEVILCLSLILPLCDKSRERQTLNDILLIP